MKSKISQENRKNFSANCQNCYHSLLRSKHPPEIGAKYNYDGKDAPPFPPDFSGDTSLKKYLEPEILIESDHPDIVVMAKSITDGAPDSWEAAVRLSKWVGKEVWLART